MSCTVGFLFSLILLCMRENRTILSILVFLVNNCSFSRHYKIRQCVITIHDSSAYYNLRQRAIIIYDSLVIAILDNCYYNFRQIYTIYDYCYYNLRQVLQLTTLLQLTTEHTINSVFEL